MPWQALASEAPETHLMEVKSEAAFFMTHIAK